MTVGIALSWEEKEGVTHLWGEDVKGLGMGVGVRVKMWKGWVWVWGHGHHTSILQPWSSTNVAPLAVYIEREVPSSFTSSAILSFGPASSPCDSHFTFCAFLCAGAVGTLCNVAASTDRPSRKPPVSCDATSTLTSGRRECVSV